MRQIKIKIKREKIQDLFIYADYADLCRSKIESEVLYQDVNNINMVQSCAAYNCTNRYSKESKCSFHRFPKNPEICKKWVLATKRDNFAPSKFSVICSDHFIPANYINNGKKPILKSDAIPTVFNFPSNFVKNYVPRKEPKKSHDQAFEDSLDRQNQNLSHTKAKLRLRQVKTLKQKIRRKELKVWKN